MLRINLKFQLAFTLLSSLLSFSIAPYAWSAELLMLEQTGCSWCARWHKEIGPIYPKTEEAEIAPLRVVDIHDPWPSDLQNIRSGQFTPTFVVVHEGKEIGRIRGYAGDEFFWPLLDELLQKIPNA